MEKEFVPYTEALELKQLGFDEPCFGYYHEDKSLTYTNMVSQNTNSFWKINNKIVSAPLYQQAFRWFREKYDLNYVIIKAESWFYTINGCNTQEGFNTYKEAEIACLTKLIEIVQGGSHE